MTGGLGTLMDKAELLRFLHLALDSPLGIVIESPNVERLRSQLYEARRAAGREREKFDALSLVCSPVDDTQLWIVKTSRGSTNDAKSRRVPFAKGYAPAV